MSSIFPLRDTVTRDEDREPRLVDLDGETADEVFEALSAGTTREIFLSLQENPQTASDLADETDTSVQNVQYHLGKLDDAALIEVVDTWYSERGTEMKVYAPSDDSLVLFAGRDKQSTLRSLLNRVAGIFTVLVPVSVLAGLSARWTGDGGESDPEVFSPADDGTTDPTGDQADDDIEGQTDDGFTGQATDDTETSPDTEDVTHTEAFEFDSASESDRLADGVVVENNTAYVFDDGTTWEVEDATVTEITRPEADERMTLVEGDVDDAVEESAFLVRGDQGEAGTQVPLELADGTADTTATIAGLDPAIAVGVSVLLGGLVVVGGLAAWYGLPGRSDAPAGAD